jgi:hypothetical protein
MAAANDNDIEFLWVKHGKSGRVSASCAGGRRQPRRRKTRF